MSIPPPAEQTRLLHREITETIIRAFYDTYNELGYGFPEFVCTRALALTLRELELTVHEEVYFPVWYRERRVGGFKADLLVNDLVIIEVKAQ